MMYLLLAIIVLCGAGVAFGGHEAVMSDMIAQLEKRDESLHSIIQEQREMIDEQSAIIHTLQIKHDDLVTGYASLQKRVDVLERRNNKQTKLITVLTQQTDKVKQTFRNKEIQVTEMIQRLNLLEIRGGTEPIKTPKLSPETAIKHEYNRRFVLADAETVAFHATFAADSTISSLTVGSTIPFNSVKLNIGGVYHPSTSLFIAPREGLYIFSTSIMSSLTHVYNALHVGIMKNGTYLAGAYVAANGNVNGNAEQGSVTIATEMKVGEQVWVQHVVHDNGAVYGGGLTSFMGCLIMPY